MKFVKEICMRCLTDLMREVGVFEEGVFDTELLKRVEADRCIYNWAPLGTSRPSRQIIAGGIPIYSVPNFCKYSLEHLMRAEP